MVEELTKDNIKEKISQDKPIIIDFYGDWCAPCKRFAPVFEKVSKDFDSVEFAKFDIDVDERVTATKLGIRSVPCIVFFNKDEVDRIIGEVTEEEFRERVNKLCH